MNDKNPKTDIPQIGQPPQTVKCFVLPIDMMDSVRDTVKKAPWDRAKETLALLSTCQVMDVPVKMPDD